MEELLRILLAACLGGVIGLEREAAHKEAGLRTNILIAVGSTLITLLSVHIAATRGGDPARLAAQIVSGIGFLGAGAILQAHFSVHGLTTAATIWVVSAIGIAVGFGLTLLALAVTLLVVIVLTLFKFISSLLEKNRLTSVYAITTEGRAAVLFDVRSILTELHIPPRSWRVTRQGSRYEIEVVISASEAKNREFLERVMPIAGLVEIQSEQL